MDEGRTRDVAADPGLAAVRTLADRLRADGVVSVASPLLALARPAGVDLLNVLPVLAAELAHEWRCAADALTVLHPDRLQLLSAAALIGQGAQGSQAPPRRVDPETLARAVVLRHAVQAPDDGRTLDEGNLLLDRTWAVLADLRRQATSGVGRETGQHDPAAAGASLPAETELDAGSRLPAHLDAAAATGALIGLLAPWLPPPRVEPVSRIDGLLTAVSTLARRHQDEPWWLAMTALGTCAATVSVAGAYAVATHPGPPSAAVAQTLSDPALTAAVDDALRSARSVGSEPGIAAPLVESVRPGVVAVTAAQAPAPSPSQQARAAAERAAAERAATQQAFVERATATRAAARATAAGAGVAASAAGGTGSGGTGSGGTGSGGSRGSTSGDSAAPASAARDSAARASAARDSGARGSGAAPDGSGSAAVAPDEVPVAPPAGSAASITMPSSGLPAARSAPDGVSTVPPIAQVQADLGETEESVQLGVWDTLMGPR